MSLNTLVAVSRSAKVKSKETWGEVPFEELIKAIEKLEVIDIRLEAKDNPQLIFESLNSCGKDLEEADKVRNYLLMSLSSKKQEDYYHAY